MMKMDANKSTHNYGVDIYRVVIMTWIVLFHYTTRYDEIFQPAANYPFRFENGGSVGVSLFFMISGFFMAKSLIAEDYGLRFLLGSLVKRYFRLWKPYVLAVMVVALWLMIWPVEGRGCSLTDFLVNLFLIVHPGINYVDGAHWFLASLFILQSVIMTVLLLRNRRWRSIVIFLSFALSVLLITINTPPPILQPITGWGKHFFDLTLGVIIYMTMKMKNKVGLAMTVIGCIRVTIDSIEHLVYILFFIAIVTDKMSSLSNHLPDVLKKSISYMGNLTFMWYLLHQNIGFSVHQHWIDLPIAGEWQVIIPMITTVLLASIFDKVETSIPKCVKQNKLQIWNIKN